MIHSSIARELSMQGESTRIGKEISECEKSIKRNAKAGLRYACVYPDAITMHSETLAYLNVAGYKVSHEPEYQEYKIEW